MPDLYEPGDPHDEPNSRDLDAPDTAGRADGAAPDVSQPRRGADDVGDVRQAMGGDADAFARLYDRWFDRVVDLAFRIVRDRERAADVAHDAFLNAHRNLASLTDPYSFGGWLLRITRNRAFDVAARERRAAAVDESQLAIIERSGAAAMSAPAGFAVEDRLGRAARPDEAVEDNELVDLVWSAADALGERDRELLDLHLRHGLEPADIADVVGINRNAANQALHRVRQRLAAAIGARVLWRGGAPKCATLGALLPVGAASVFDGDVVRAVARHVDACDECAERQRLQLDPAVLFAALPMLSVPALKSRVAAALARDGVLPPSVEAGAQSAEPLESEGRDGADRGDGSGNSDPLANGLPEPAAASARELAATSTLATTVAADPAMSERKRRVLLASALAMLVIVGLGVVFTVLPRDGGTDLVTVTNETTVAVTTAPETDPRAATTTRGLTTRTTVDPRGAASSSVPVVVAPTVTTTAATSPPVATTAVPTSPVTTTTSPPAPTATLTISRSTVAMPGYAPSAVTAPRLTWDVANVASVSVSGPNLSATTPTGNVVVCPGVPSASYCTLTPSIGTVTYLLRGFDESGDVVIERSVTLTVTV